MPDSEFDQFQSPEVFAIRQERRRTRLQECAQYCRRLARESDRAEAVRSLTALAAEFEARAAFIACPPPGEQAQQPASAA